MNPSQNGQRQSNVAAVFERYVPDGPSYIGRVEVRVCSEQVQVTTWDGDAPYIAVGGADRVLAGIGEVLELTDDLLLKVFGAIDSESRSLYLENDIANLERARVRAVRFTDDVDGAILLWGECSFVSVIRFEETGGIDVTVEAVG